MEFTDRYGGNWPDPATVCKGQCEGTGRVPISRDEQEPYWRARYDEAHQDCPPECSNGWHFVVCPDCNGTGKRATA